MLKYNFYLFFISILIEESISIRVRSFRMMTTPKNWKNECPFYNEARIRPVLENYLADQDKTCSKLGLCPKVPDWINQRVSDSEVHYNEDDEDDDGDNYDNFSILPNFRDGKPLHLFYNFFIDNISSMNLQKSTFRIDFFVEILWFIPKTVCDDYYKILKYEKVVVNNETEIEIQVQFFHFFWLPDTFIANSLKSLRQMRPVDTRSLQLNIENLNDEIPFCYLSYQTKDAVTVQCDMNFHVYPFDAQKCAIQIRSFAFNNQSIVIHWESMDWNKLLELPGYSVSLKHNRTITKEWLHEFYSVLYVEIMITRKLINILAGVYFSTFLIVIIMISTFWLNSFLITDRINIGVISILALYDQYNESKKGLPSIGHMHPLSYWIIICMLFVFGQLLQNSIFYYIVINKKELANKKTKTLNPFNGKRKNQIQDINRKEKEDDEFLSVFINVPLDKTSLDYIPMKFDLISRLIFCLFIIFFLAIYWPSSIKLSNTYNLLHLTDFDY